MAFGGLVRAAARQGVRCAEFSIGDMPRPPEAQGLTPTTSLAARLLVLDKGSRVLSSSLGRAQAS